MPVKKIASPNPKYLAATDILIGDMSDINYDFLLFDRPVVLLANDWLRKNFPDIGIKTDLRLLEDAVMRSLRNPEEYSKQRDKWLKMTMHLPGRNSSQRVIDKIIGCSKIDDPSFLLIHGDEEVLKTHLDPLYKVLRRKQIPVDYQNYYSRSKIQNNDKLIIVSAYNGFLRGITAGFKVHIDHGVKGIGASADFERVIAQYKDNDYFPSTDLHITEGKVSFEKTQQLLGPYSERAVMVGYSKSDTLLELNVPETKREVCLELGFDSRKPLITYAPTGKYKYPFKPGGSLSYSVIRYLKKMAKNNDFNVLIKLKILPKWHPDRITAKVRRYLA